MRLRPAIAWTEVHLLEMLQRIGAIDERCAAELSVNPSELDREARPDSNKV